MFSAIVLVISVGAAVLQLAPSDPTICGDAAKREAFYEREATALQNLSDVPSGSAEAKARTKLAKDRFFKRLDQLAATANWSTQQKNDAAGRLYWSPDVQALEHAPTKLILKMMAIREQMASDSEPRKCRDLIDILNIEDDLNSNHERIFELMSNSLDAEARKLGIVLK
jgi:hypothetical protein